MQDPAIWQAALIGIAFAALSFLVWQNRKKIAGFQTPYIDVIIGKAIFWLVGVVILVTISTAILSIFGVTSTIRVLSAENLAYLAGAYALVRWAQK